MASRPDILAAIETSGLSARSTLRDWLLQNHDAFAEQLRTRKPDWTVLAKVFADAGLADARGNPPKAAATRKTWQRVRSALRGAAKRPAGQGSQEPRRQPSVTDTTSLRAPRTDQPAQPEAATPSGGSSPSMEKIRAGWDAQRPKMPEPL